MAEFFTAFKHCSHRPGEREQPGSRSQRLLINWSCRNLIVGLWSSCISQVSATKFFKSCPFCQTMHHSVRFLQQACRITLFTRANCSLCINAKNTLSRVWDTRPFDYKEIDVMTQGAKNWRDIYEFDTPVVSLMKYLVGN